MKHRKEIDGLRAIAVVAVILCHAGVPFLPGGFLGVDVFFVISGFLITTLIVDHFHAGTFSIWAFYGKRARRILPALFVVMLFCIPAAYLWLLPDDLENFGQSLVATVGFGNNVLVWKTSGYWALEADFKPLVHTWSLAVEEQFYLVVPFIVVASLRFGRRFLFLAFTLIFIGSLAWSQWASVYAPTFNFLWIMTRAWELALGAMASLFANGRIVVVLGRHRQWLSTAGLLMLSASFVIFSQQTRHPSVLTLVPVLGTALMILFASSSTWAGRLLGAGPLTAIGLISYSAYLWHHPLFTFVRITRLEEPSLMTMLGVSLLSLALAYPSWRFIENPCRRPEQVPAHAFYPVICVVGLAIGAFGFYCHHTSGFLREWPELRQDVGGGAKQSIAFNSSAFDYIQDIFPTGKNRNLLILGHSFARDFLNCGVTNDYFSDFNVVYRQDISLCNDSLIGTKRRLLQEADVIVYSANLLDAYLCIPQHIGRLSKVTKARFIVVGPKNFGWNNNAVMLLPPDSRHHYRTRVLPEVLESNDKIGEVLPEEIYVDQLGMIVDEDGRVPVFTPDRKFISQDRRHLTEDGARYLGRILFEHHLLLDLK